MIGDAEADLFTFTSRADWEAVVGNNVETVTFNEFITRIPFQETPLDVGPFTFTTQEPFSPDASSLIDLEPYLSSPRSDGFPIDGTPYARIGVNNDLFGRGDTTVSAAFDRSITAWGADFTAAGTRELLDLALFTESNEQPIIVPVEVNTGFFGFVLDQNTPVRNIKFQSRLTLDGTERFGVDNISFLFVPEPTSLLTLGFIVFRLSRRRQAPPIVGR
ncbi:MAG: hypothetical protein AAF333_16070 [Planctomycetota bacterium]